MRLSGYLDGPVLVNQQDGLVTLTATITATVLIYPRYCKACGCKAPLPDADGALFLLCHHELGRIAWAEAEDFRPERDGYPVPGWKTSPVGLVCPECANKIEDALAPFRRNTA